MDIGIFPVAKVKHVLTFLLVHTYVVTMGDHRLYQFFVSKNWYMQLKGLLCHNDNTEIEILVM